MTPKGKLKLLAEMLLIRQQLVLVRRKQNRAPNLTTLDRIGFAVTSLFIKSSRLPKLSIVVAHSTILQFHKALVNRKYSHLFSNQNRKPGPTGPSPELIKIVVEIKQKNPKYGCIRIALLVTQLTDLKIDEFLVRRILRKHYRFAGGNGPSWLSLIGSAKNILWSVDFFRCESILLKSHWIMIAMDQFTRAIVGIAVHLGSLDGPTICRMFSEIHHSKKLPKYLSTDNDPLFKYFLWRAHLRIHEIAELKSVPETPRSHPYIERLIGTVRREFLDDQLFWN